MAREGNAAAAYDATIFKSTLPDAGQGLLFLNPPHALLLYAPLSHLSYGAAKLLWLIVSILCVGGIALLIARQHEKNLLVAACLFAALVCSPAIFAHLLIFQLGPMVAVLTFGGLLYADRKPILASCLFALLTIKPQFGLFIPIYLVAIRAWPPLLLTPLITAIAVCFSILAFGTDPWVAFYNSLNSDIAAHADRIHRDMLTFHQSIGKLDAGDAIRSAVQLAMIILVGILIFQTASRRSDNTRSISRRDAIGFTCLATAISSPSLWVYDWIIVSAALLYLANSGSHWHWPRHVQILAGLLWIAPLVPLGLAESLGVSPMLSAAIIPWLGVIFMGAFFSFVSRNSLATTKA